MPRISVKKWNKEAVRAPDDESGTGPRYELPRLIQIYGSYTAFAKRKLKKCEEPKGSTVKLLETVIQVEKAGKLTVFRPFHANSQSLLSEDSTLRDPVRAL
jgi:hypothetical protein